MDAERFPQNTIGRWRKRWNNIPPPPNTKNPALVAWGSHRHRTESWNSFRIKIPCKGNVYQPRVARNELPWVPSPTKSNPERVVSCDPPLLFSFRASDHVPPTRFEQPGHLNSGGPGKPKFRALGARHVSRPLGTCAVPRPLRQRIASLSGD